MSEEDRPDRKGGCGQSKTQLSSGKVKISDHTGVLEVGTDAPEGMVVGQSLLECQCC